MSGVREHFLSLALIREEIGLQELKYFKNVKNSWKIYIFPGIFEIKIKLPTFQPLA